MSELPRDPIPEAVSSDIDLYCLECGYNLRGLSGDPRRCPECGHLNPMGDLELPAELISAQLRRMETAPAVCTGAALFGSLFLVLLAIIVVSERGRTDGGAFVCLGVPSAFAGFVWIIYAGIFRSSCLGKPGWGSALWRYHVYGLTLAGAVAGLIAFPMAVLTSVNFGRRQHQPLLETGAVVSLGAAMAVIVFIGRPVHRRLKEILTPLQREVAVIVARDVLRRRLGTVRRW